MSAHSIQSAFTREIHEALAAGLRTDNSKNAGAPPLLVHSDIMGARAAIPLKTPPASMLTLHLEQILSLRPPGGNIIFPTFNYDFTRTAEYRPTSDPSQVGVLSEYARTHWATWRSGPPIFNFCGRGVAPQGTDARATSATNNVLYPFGVNSIFHWLYQSEAQVVLYGVGLDRFTAIHYIECFMDHSAMDHSATDDSVTTGPLYRYDKDFPGCIVHSDAPTSEVTLRYHVRPKDRTLNYDWEKLRLRGLRLGYLRSVQHLTSAASVIDLRAMTDDLVTMLKNEPLFLLTPTTQQWVSEALRINGGRRFKYQDFEG